MMHISLPGVLLRAAERLETTRDSKHLGFPVRQLLQHLRQLKASPERHAEFFALWVDDCETPAFEAKAAAEKMRGA